jgi:multicomponent Na+:H+ antiporter subunit G
MSELREIVALVFLFAGAFFLLVGSVGIVRLPDFFTRTHATSKSDTLGIMLVLGGLVVSVGLTLNSAKLLLAIVFVALANPVGSHALARAALRFGLKPQLRDDMTPPPSENKVE